MNNLPDIDFCSKSTEEVEKMVLDSYQKVSKRSLAQGDPVRLFLEGIASIITHQRVLIDFAAKQNLLAYSRDSYLDHIGDLFGVKRMESKRACTTLEFYLEQPRGDVTLIPMGTRVTPGDDVFFTTTDDCEIEKGSLSVEVKAVATEEGDRCNGYEMGSITKLVDPLPYVSVKNITVTAGGSDVEDDEKLRERIHLAPESFSVAGPEGAYRYFAMAAHQDIVDVKIYSPEPNKDDPSTWGRVWIYPLLKGGVIPSQEILDKVTDICSSNDVRPTSDRVEARAPVEVPYDLKVTYWIDRASIPTDLVAHKVEEALQDYLVWQRSSLGRDLNPTELVFMLRRAGAKRVKVESPSFIVLKPWEIAKEGEVQLSFGGLEDG